MAIDLDDEILQDFLVEAGEILELLSEQLVELEQSPQDADLLNAVFRGFHTVKGGAGFLALDPMVDCCHVCEDVFNVLRQGDRAVSAGLMDCVLQGLDAVQNMFVEIQSGSEPTPATAELLEKLKVYAVAGDDEPGDNGAGGEDNTVETVVNTPSGTVVDTLHDDTDDDFNALLNAMDSGADKPSQQPVAASSTDEITDDEFESLLDDLHGKGKHAGGKPGDAGAESKKEPAQTASTSDAQNETTDE
ncbi:Signal transduction histidine kinase CheA, partial [hydrothermal vent metagenome]